jgi:hypothetical protein
MRFPHFISLLLLSSCALYACTTTTIVQKAQPDGGGPPGTEEDGGTDPGTVDAGPPPDRTVSGTWEKVQVHPPDGDPIKELASVFVRNANDVYVAEGASNLGTGYYHWDGKGWTGVRYDGFATALVGLKSGELLAYGSELNIKTKTGDAWERLPEPTNAFFSSIWGTSMTNLYASAGAAGNIRFDGSGWTPIQGIETRSGSFFGTSDKDVWFTQSYDGKNELSHFDGTSWTNHWANVPDAVKKFPTDGPYGPFGSAADDVWTIGRKRTLIRWDGKSWSTIPGPNDEWGCDLLRGWASSKKNAWLVGKGGCVFHWDGANWKSVPSGVTFDIYGIHGSDPEHVWIAPYNTTTVLRLVPEVAK